MTRIVPLLSRSLLTLLPFFISVPGATAPVEIGGRLRAPDGSGLGGARIELLPLASTYEFFLMELAGGDTASVAASTTDRSGLFRLNAPHPGMWKVVARARGYRVMEFLLAPLLDDTEVPEVTLAAASHLTLTVVTPDGSPLKDVYVLPWSEKGQIEAPLEQWRPVRTLTRTGLDGTAVLPRTPGEEVGVTLVSLGFEPKSVRLAGDATVSLALADRRVLEIVVREGDGRPVRDVVLVLDPSRPRAAALTNELGRARLDISSPDMPELRLVTPDGRTWSGRPPVPKGDAGPAIVVLPEAVTLMGAVVDTESRESLADAVVWVRERPGCWTLTDRNGIYVLENPAMGSATIAAGAPGRFQTRVKAEVGRDALQQGPTLALAPSAAVTGQVLDPGGQPVTGALLRAQPGTFEGQVRQLQRPVVGSQGRSRADGRFHLIDLLPRVPYDLVIEAQGFAPRRIVLPILERGLNPHPLVVTLEQGRSARGQVVDEEGRPLAGATAQLLDDADVKTRLQAASGSLERNDGSFSASTAEDGTFQIEHLPAGRFDLIVTRQGFSPALMLGVELAEEVSEVDLGPIRLTRGVSIAGIVRDGTRPLEGARVFLRARHESPTGRSEFTRTAVLTDAAGRFEFGELTRGEKADVYVHHVGYAPAQLRDVVAPTDEPIEVVLDRAARIEGWVRGEDATPIVGAEVRVRRESETNSPPEPGMAHLTVRTDQEGRFVVSEIPPGRIRIDATAHGYRPDRRHGLLLGSGTTLRSLELTLRKGLAIQGSVLADGRPVPAAQVALAGSSTTTDGNGHYRLAGVAPGRHRLVAWHPDLGRIEREIDVDEGIEEVDLAFEGGAAVAGRVLGPDGEPVSGAVVFLRPLHGKGGPRIEFTSRDGSFHMAHVAPGTYRVSVKREGYGPIGHEPELHVATDPVTELRLVLLPATTLSGKLLGLAPEDLSTLTIAARRAGAVVEGVVGSGGEYRIAGLGPGEWLVSAVAPGTGKAVQGHIRLEPGEAEARLDLELGSTPSS